MRESYVTPYFGHRASVYISMLAAEGLAERVSFYISGKYAALRNDPEGPLEVLPAAKGRGRLINSIPLCKYLDSMTGGGDYRLPARFDRRHGALVISAAPGKRMFSPVWFDQVDFKEIHRSNRPVADGGQLRVNAQAPKRCEAFISGSSVALLEDPKGRLVRNTYGRERSYTSPDLARYCRAQWGDSTVYYRDIPGGIVLSNDYVALLRLKDTQQFRPMPDGGERYLSLERDLSLCLSPEAQRVLGSRVSVYICGGVLALRADAQGDLRFCHMRRRGYAFSQPFYQQVLVCYPMAQRLKLVPNGSLWVLEQEGVPVELMPESYFCRLMVGEGKTQYGGADQSAGTERRAAVGASSGHRPCPVSKR